MAGAALLRPLGPHASPRLRLAVSLGLGLGVAGTALLASLRGHGKAEPLAFYAFLTLCTDALGQLLAPLGWPVWPLMVLLVGAVAVAETLPVALGLGPCIAPGRRRRGHHALRVLATRRRRRPRLRGAGA